MKLNKEDDVALSASFLQEKPNKDVFGKSL
jgi:hypothetical protein